MSEKETENGSISNEFAGGGKKDFKAGVDESEVENIKERFLERLEKRLSFGKKKLSEETEKTGDENIKANLRTELEILEKKHEYMMEFINLIAPEIRRVEKESQRDNISGLLREPALVEMYGHALAGLQKDEQMVLIAFDLDKFRDINESIGHVEADKVLKKIGETISESTRDNDFASRVGGDEFVVILNNVRKETSITGVAKETNIVELVQRIAGRISEIQWEKGGERHGFSFSAGLSVIGYGEKPYYEQARSDADRLAGYSKVSGRNRLTVKQDERYELYRLEGMGKGGKYALEKTGDIKETEAMSEEKCLIELRSNLQRVIEEIERFFNQSGQDLRNYLRKNYKTTDMEGLSIKEIGKILYYVRKQKEDLKRKEI